MPERTGSDAASSPRSPSWRGPVEAPDTGVPSNYLDAARRSGLPALASLCLLASATFLFFLLIDCHAGDCSDRVLPRLILMAGAKLTAEEALAFGLVDRIVPSEGLAAAVAELAAPALAASPAHGAAIKAMTGGRTG